VKKYQAKGTGASKTSPEQVQFTAVLEDKCLAKESMREQVLANMTPSPGANTDWIKEALQEKSKQSAVTTMMQQVHNQYQTNLAKKGKKATVKKATKMKKAKPSRPNKIKTNQVPTTMLQDISVGPSTDEETVMYLCGCQHGDLSALRSFAKAIAKYYSRPNKFLEGRSCLDCKVAVTNMESTGRSQCAVVYYCDKGIKRFDTPDEDPMKSALTYDLILCPNCEAKRLIEYNKADSGRQSSDV
jgi:hypothetical protein